MQRNVHSIKEDWTELRGFMQKQVGTLTEVKDRHDESVKAYKNYCEFLEPGTLKEKMLKSIQRLQTETERLSMPVKKLETDLDYVREKRDQQKKELDRVLEKNRKLRERLDMPEDKKPSSNVEVNGLREKMQQMRDRMEELERTSIDVGRDPGKAIEQISNPLLDDLNLLVNTQFQPTLEENMSKKGELERQETEINGKIYDEQMRQVTLKQEIEEQANVWEDMSGEIKYFKQRINFMHERKIRMQERVEVLTKDFVNRATTLAGELDETKHEVQRWQRIRDRFERLSSELTTDRFNGSYRY